MQKVLVVEGMQCPHCKAAVEAALQGVAGVTQVAVDLETREALVTLAQPVEDALLRAAVEAEDFTVVSIQ